MQVAVLLAARTCAWAEYDHLRADRQVVLGQVSMALLYIVHIMNALTAH